MKIILIVLLSIFLTGCGFFENLRKQDPPVVAPQVVNIDKSALEQCAFLKEDLVIKNFQDSLNAYGELATLYANCANKQATSVKLLKQFGNIK